MTTVLWRPENENIWKLVSYCKFLKIIRLLFLCKLQKREFVKWRLHAYAYYVFSLSTFFQIMEETFVYTVNNQQKVRSMNGIISIFKNLVQWGYIILLTLQLSIIIRKCKSVKALIHYFHIPWITPKDPPSICSNIMDLLNIIIILYMSIFRNNYILRHLCENKTGKRHTDFDRKMKDS